MSVLYHLKGNLILNDLFYCFEGLWPNILPLDLKTSVYFFSPHPLVAHWRRLNCVGSLKVFNNVKLWAPNLSSIIFSFQIYWIKDQFHNKHRIKFQLLFVILMLSEWIWILPMRFARIYPVIFCTLKIRIGMLLHVAI